jgi:DNA-binding NtrC family response regulator
MAMASALLVSADPVTIQQFTLALRELSISSEACQGETAAISLLTRRKFDAVIVDLQLREQAGVIMDAVRLSASNRTAVTCAIGGSDVDATAAFRRRTGFVFGRPLSPQSIRNTLKPNLGLRERRRTHRSSSLRSICDPFASLPTAFRVVVCHPWSCWSCMLLNLRFNADSSATLSARFF